MNLKIFLFVLYAFCTYNIKRTEKVIDNDTTNISDNKKLSPLHTIPYRNIQSVIAPKILDYQTEVTSIRCFGK